MTLFGVCTRLPVTGKRVFLEENTGRNLRMSGVEICGFGALEGGRKGEFEKLAVDAGLCPDLHLFVGARFRGDKRYAEGVAATACGGACGELRGCELRGPLGERNAYF